MNAKTRAELRREMYLEMRSTLGSGYVKEYYEELAKGFVEIAEGYVLAAESKAHAAGRRRTPAVRYRFLGRFSGKLVWESVGSTTGDSRVKQITVSARRFWGRDYPPPTSENVASLTNDRGVS